MKSNPPNYKGKLFLIILFFIPLISLTSGKFSTMRHSPNQDPVSIEQVRQMRVSNTEALLKLTEQVKQDSL
jgi:hypothetical protein